MKNWPFDVVPGVYISVFPTFNAPVFALRARPLLVINPIQLNIDNIGEIASIVTASKSRRWSAFVAVLAEDLVGGVGLQWKSSMPMRVFDVRW